MGGANGGSDGSGAGLRLLLTTWPVELTKCVFDELGSSSAKRRLKFRLNSELLLYFPLFLLLIFLERTVSLLQKYGNDDLRLRVKKPKLSNIT